MRKILLVANVSFHRYKFISKHLQLSSSLLIYICAIRQLGAFNSAPRLASDVGSKAIKKEHYRTILRLVIIISAIFAFSGCKTPSLIGKYEQPHDNISILNLNSDSTFSAVGGTCMSTSNLEGHWTTKDNHLLLFPKTPSGIHKDTITNKYVYDKINSSNLLVRPIDSIIIFADINTNYSQEIYNIKRGKLYFQYKDYNNIINYDRCPFYKIPKDAIKAKRFHRKYEIKCSGLNGFKRLLIRLRIIQ